MSEKSAEFKVQLLETFASLITAAFGLVAALAWNDTIKLAVKMLFPTDSGEIYSMIVYALIVTILAVIMTLFISRSLSKAKKALHLEKEE
ncbi:MAG: hypothetical protein IJV90_06550 [Candidatus Methanomethylophilaceae archaeon]|nr:hypothetical protein [Candidatus Methanomethylophilaceae archaeon]MBQ7406053.1 hypothetical protein [Candidatus Methanomethylophilaceae archaeon]MBR2347961.1 hypothetical protein [Candidatus Methanomethylophilaceae archaeon]